MVGNDPAGLSHSAQLVALTYSSRLLEPARRAGAHVSR